MLGIVLDRGPWDVRRTACVDATAWPTPLVSKYREASGLDGYTVGFLTAGGEHADRLTWGGLPKAVDSNEAREDGVGEYDADVTVSGFLRNEFSQFRQAGGKVVFVFGGAANQPIEATVSDVSAIVGLYTKAIKNYGMTHLEFDFEGGFLADSAAVDRHVAAIRQVLQAHPQLKVSYCPPGDAGSAAGLNTGGAALLGKVVLAGVIPSLVNIMAMSFSPGSPGSLVEASTAALDAVHAQFAKILPLWDPKKLWRRLGVTPMFGKGFTGETFTLDDMAKLRQWATERDLGCLSGWSADRDSLRERQGSDRPDPNGAVWDTGIGQDPFDFCKIIAGYKTA
ncbi:glycoside hydrolase family 18 protein [Streptomyces violascens]|uniref:hypothetical protein n=1 Tax=Streptomyces violascens TaxID=67381 RepID=UPI0036B1BD21